MLKEPLTKFNIHLSLKLFIKMGIERTHFNILKTICDKPGLDFPGGSDSKVSVYNVGDLGSIPGSGSSLEKEMAPTLVLLPRKSHGRRSLVPMGLQRVGHD